MSVLINNRLDLIGKLNTLNLFFRQHYENMLLSDFDIDSNIKLFDLHDNNDLINELNNNDVEYILDNFKVKLKIYALKQIKKQTETQPRRKI